MKEAKRRRSSGLASRRDTETNLNRDSHPAEFNRNQGIAVALVFILIFGVLIGGWAIGTVNAYLHPTCKPDLARPGAPCQDPSQIIWQGLDSGAHTIDSPQWKQHIGNGNSPIQYKAPATCNSVWGLPNTQGCIDMNYAGNSTVTLIDQTPIGSLSTASKNLLGFHFTWGIRVGTNFPLRQLTEWGYFLTTNSTPRTNWAPGHVELTDGDPNVLFQNYWTCFAGCFVNNNSNTMNIQEYTFLKRAINGQPYIDDIYNENQGCDQTGSAFFCANGLNIVTANVPNQAFQFDSAVYLNYTGVQNAGTCSVAGNPGIIQAGSTGCSWQLNEPFTGNSQSQYWLNSQSLPWFQLQSQQLYLGFFVGPTLGSDPAFSFNSAGAQPGMDIFTFQPTTTGPPTDTGSFFAQAFQALWNDYTWLNGGFLAGVSAPPIFTQLGIAPSVFAGVQYFFAFIINGLRAILNGVGQTFGLGNLGDNVIAFFSGITTWLTNVFGGIIGQLTNIANGVSGEVTAIVNLFAGWSGFLVSSLTVLGSIPTILLIIWNDVLPAVYAVSFIILLWWVFGTYQAWRDFESGDFIAVLPVIGMIFTLLLWLGSSVSFNPISANTTVTSAYGTAFNQVSWFLTILIPVFLVVMFHNMGNSGEHERHKTLEHYSAWMNITHLVFIKIFHFSFILAEQSWGIIVSIKTLVAGWL